MMYDFHLASIALKCQGYSKAFCSQFYFSVLSINLTKKFYYMTHLKLALMLSQQMQLLQNLGNRSKVLEKCFHPQLEAFSHR